jgi:D-alanyl-D-alanine carboxypeptidase
VSARRIRAAACAAVAAVAVWAAPAGAVQPPELFGYVPAGEDLLAAPGGPARTWNSDGGAGRIVEEREIGAQVWTLLDFGERNGWALSETVEAATPPLPPAATTRLKELVAGGGRTGTIFVDLDTGQRLFASGADHPFILASVAKLFTVSAAADARRLEPGLAARILLPSDNRLADRLARRLGAGGLRTGAGRIEAFARKHGVTVSLRDGSGVSRADRATPAGAVELLRALDVEPEQADVLDALPDAGRSGTLAGRMRGTVAAGRCHAKTGTLHDVSTLAGICVTRGERRVAFAAFMNACVVWRARRRQDAMLRVLVGFDR